MSEVVPRWRWFWRSTVPWATIAALGWLTQSAAITAIAPLLLVMGFLVSARDSRGAGFDPFEPIWLLGALFAFEYLLLPVLDGLNPRAFAALLGYEDLPAGQFQLACVISGLAFIALVFGYSRETFARPRSSDPGGFGDAPNGAILGLASALLALGTLSVLAGVARSGVTVTPSTLLSAQMRNAVVRSFAGHGYLSVGFTLLMLGPPCLTLWASKVRTRWSWVAVAVASVLAIVMLAGLAGTRIGVLAILLGVPTVIHYRVRPIRMGQVLIIAAVAIAAAIAEATVRGTASDAGLLAPFATLSGTLDGFNHLVNALARIHSFQWGGTILGDVVLTYLPRALWSGKPVIYGAVHAQQLVMPGLYQDVAGGSTYPIGILAEGYVNFAVFGAVGIPLLVGALARGLRRLTHPELNDWGLLLIAWVLPNLIGLLRAAGAGLVQIALGAVVLLPLVVSASPGRNGWIRLRRRSQQAAGP